MYRVKKIEGGTINRLEEVIEWAKKQKDGFYSVEMKRYGDRTQAQNKFYWLMLSMISKETGHSSEELHYYYKNKFIETENGFPSSRELNKEEFAEYVESIKNHIAELGISLPILE